MKQKTILLATLFSPLFFISTASKAFAAIGPDSCTINDDCQQASWFPWLIHSNLGMICLPGCNLNAAPDPEIESCFMSLYPTVWYVIDVDDHAAALNIEIYSSEIEAPTFAVFESVSGCDSLEQLSLGNGSFDCIIGANGVAKAIGTPIQANGTYYIAVSSIHDIGGNFSLCVGAVSDPFHCVIDRDLQIKARSNGGPLEGPFDPAETISFCLNVNEFTAAENGCQWFQGLVPVFGNGWDPSSFDANGQPLNATVNGIAMGEPGNGLYGTSTWDWFTDSDYHHDHEDLHIGDLDGNGRIDMCNSLYELDCPHTGIQGACCNPCWDDTSGDILPPGWFAYGINGSCNEPGPPVRVDWGDGNTCGSGMGPWTFCFDLITRDVPDCMLDSTRRELSVGFYTFADGETGAWTGSSSVCALDHPVKLSLQAKCGRVTILEPEVLPDLCSGDIFKFKIESAGVSFWEWNISPFWAVPLEINQGFNGYTIEAPLVNHSGQPVNIKGVFIGYIDNGTNDKIVRPFSFKLNHDDLCETVSTEDVTTSGQWKMDVYPVPASERVVVKWNFLIQSEARLEVYNAHGNLMESHFVSPADGPQKNLDIQAWSPGIYYISLSNSQFRKVVRMVRM